MHSRIKNSKVKEKISSLCKSSPLTGYKISQNSKILMKSMLWVMMSNRFTQKQKNLTAFKPPINQQKHQEHMNARLFALKLNKKKVNANVVYNSMQLTLLFAIKMKKIA